MPITDSEGGWDYVWNPSPAQQQALSEMLEQLYDNRVTRSPPESEEEVAIEGQEIL